MSPTTRMRRLVMTGCMVMSVALWASTALAFTEPRTYFDDPSAGGGGGRWFTGSPAEGYGCAVCHTGNGSVELYVTGLPELGYVPGESYDVRVWWPEFAIRAAEIREDEDAEPASMGLVAELVAETGIGSGTVAIASAGDADPNEVCVLPEGAQGTQLYEVRPGEDTVEQPTECEASSLGQRCLMAVLSCGARELRFTWTAPDVWQGPIWFSAGFVATEQVSGDPTRDAVTQIQMPLLPAASAADSYESKLYSGCAVSSRPGHGDRGTGWLSLALLAILGARRRVRGRN